MRGVYVSITYCGKSQHGITVDVGIDGELWWRFALVECVLVDFQVLLWSVKRR